MKAIALFLLCFDLFLSLSTGLEVGKVYAYDYDLSHGVYPNKGNVAKRISIFSKVYIQPQPEGKWIVQVRDIKLHNSPESFSLHGLMSPFAINFNDSAEGMSIDSLTFSPYEETWSKNFKKGLASLFEINYMQGPEKSTHSTREFSLHGECEASYYLKSSKCLVKRKNLLNCKQSKANHVLSHQNVFPPVVDPFQKLSRSIIYQYAMDDNLDIKGIEVEEETAVTGLPVGIIKTKVRFAFNEIADESRSQELAEMGQEVEEDLIEASAEEEVIAKGNSDLLDEAIAQWKHLLSVTLLAKARNFTELRVSTQIIDLVDIMRHLDYDQKKHLFESHESIQEIKQDVHLTLLMFYQLLALDGSEDAFKVAKDIFRPNCENPLVGKHCWSALNEFLGQLPFNDLFIDYSSELINYCQSDTISSHESLRHTCWLSVASIIRKAPRIGLQETATSLAQFKLTSDWSWDASSLLNRAPQHILLAIKVIKNLASLEGLPLLMAIISDKSNELRLRTEASWSLVKVDEKYPNDVRPLAWNVFQDRDEDHEVRISGLVAWLWTSPPLPQLYLMIDSLSEDPDAQVITFAYSMISSLASQKFIHLRELSKNCKILMETELENSDHFQAFIKKKLLNSHITFHESEGGKSWCLGVIGSKSEAIPRTVYVQLGDAYRVHSYSFTLISNNNVRRLINHLEERTNKEPTDPGVEAAVNAILDELHLMRKGSQSMDMRFAYSLNGQEVFFNNVNRDEDPVKFSQAFALLNLPISLQIPRKMSIITHTEMGLPLYFQLVQGTFTSQENLVASKPSLGAIELQVNYLTSQETIISFGSWIPFTTLRFGRGIRKQATLTLPFSLTTYFHRKQGSGVKFKVTVDAFKADQDSSDIYYEALDSYEYFEYSESINRPTSYSSLLLETTDMYDFVKQYFPDHRVHFHTYNHLSKLLGAEVRVESDHFKSNPKMWAPSFLGLSDHKDDNYNPGHYRISIVKGTPAISEVYFDFWLMSTNDSREYNLAISSGEDTDDEPVIVQLTHEKVSATDSITKLIIIDGLNAFSIDGQIGLSFPSEYDITEDYLYEDQYAASKVHVTGHLSVDNLENMEKSTLNIMGHFYRPRLQVDMMRKYRDGFHVTWPYSTKSSPFLALSESCVDKHPVHCMEKSARNFQFYGLHLNISSEEGWDTFPPKLGFEVSRFLTASSCHVLEPTVTERGSAIVDISSFIDKSTLTNVEVVTSRATVKCPEIESMPIPWPSSYSEFGYNSFYEYDLRLKLPVCYFSSRSVGLFQTLTFDGAKLHYLGTNLGNCSVLLAADCVDSNVFTLMVKEGKVDILYNKRYRITIENDRVAINGIGMEIPQPKGKATVGAIGLVRTKGWFEVWLPNGILVTSDSYQVFAKVPLYLRGALCGVCGDFNGDSSNDLSWPLSDAGDAAANGNILDLWSIKENCEQTNQI